MARSTRVVILIKDIYIYFMGSKTLPSACYLLSDESSIPIYFTSNGYNYLLSRKVCVKCVRLLLTLL